MSSTSTPTDLFIVAVQDLYDADQAWIERLPALSERASDALAPFCRAEVTRSGRQAERLAEIAGQFSVPPSDAPNIWLRAILDDAARDSRTIVEGPLRDIAMTGAFRKGKQSERVSYETAIGLAEEIGKPAMAELLTQSRDEEAEADSDLAGLLTGLLHSIK